MKLLAFCGAAGSGKTTACQIIQKLIPDAVIVSFADPLKEIAYQMGWNGIKDKKGRKLLQLLGTECGRNCIDPNIWVYKWWERVQVHGPNKFILCDDLRFVNEALQIRQIGGRIIHITRRKVKRKYAQFFLHASERGIPAHFINYTIKNDGTKDELKTRLEMLLGN